MERERERSRESSLGKDVRRETEINRRTIDNQMVI